MEGNLKAIYMALVDTADNAFLPLTRAFEERNFDDNSDIFL